MATERFPAVSSLVLVLVAACGSPKDAESPEAPPASAASAPTADATASAAPSSAPAAEASPTERLARDLVKSGGRRIGYSASKKRFIVPIESHNDGSRSLDLRFYDLDGQVRDIERICQPGDCEEKLDEIAKEYIPKLAARIASEGYETVYSVGWPSGRTELEISSLGGKLRYDKGRLSLLREKKPAASLRVLGGKGPKAESPAAVYPVPNDKLLGVFVGGDGAAQEFFLFKLP